MNGSVAVAAGLSLLVWSMTSVSTISQVYCVEGRLGYTEYAMDLR